MDNPSDVVRRWRESARDFFTIDWQWSNNAQTNFRQVPALEFVATLTLCFCVQPETTAPHAQDAANTYVQTRHGGRIGRCRCGR